MRRYELPWAYVEAERGRWDWSAGDVAYARILAAGLKPLIVAGAAPCWAATVSVCAPGHQYAPAASKDADWIRYIHLLTARYPRAVGIEIWNEPNLAANFEPVADAARYTTLLREAYAAAKSVRRSPPVISGGLLGSPGTTSANASAVGIPDRPFLKAMFAAGAKGHLDGIGIHPYPLTAAPAAWSTDAAIQTIERVRAARNGAGDRATPIWITEMGESTASEAGFPAGVSPAHQAAAVLQLVRYAADQSDIRVALIHRLVDRTDALPIEAGFGVFTSRLEPKAAACELNRQWHGSIQC
ncbi:MAG: hypothetical protein ACR2ND_05215 [Solirubrobacteraceae bacterium]